MFFWIMYCLLWLPYNLLFPTKVIGKKNLPKNFNGVLISNHYSNVDCVLLHLKTHKHLYFLAKSELFKTKLSAWFFKKLGCIKINRGEADIEAMKNSLKVLKDGKILAIFPEGTRNKTDDDSVQQVHPGAAVIAVRAGVEVLPVCIYKRPKLFRRNIISIGEPFKIESQDPRRLTPEEQTQAADLMTAKITALRAELDEKYKKSSK